MPTSVALVDDRNVAEFAVGHALHDAGDRLAFRAGRDLARHYPADRLIERGGAALGKRAHDVALGKDADDTAAGAEDKHRADAFLGEKMRWRERVWQLGSMLTTSRPLPARMMLTVILASLMLHRVTARSRRISRGEGNDHNVLTRRRVPSHLHGEYAALHVWNMRLLELANTSANGANGLARCRFRRAALTGSKALNRNRPAKKPPTCACQAITCPASSPNETVPKPNSAFSPSQTSRNSRNRGSRQRRSKRRGRNAIGVVRAIPQQPEWAALLKDKAHRRRHRARDRRRRADHRLHRARND